jgi:hypothetical protein
LFSIIQEFRFPIHHRRHLKNVNEKYVPLNQQALQVGLELE